MMVGRGVIWIVAQPNTHIGERDSLLLEDDIDKPTLTPLADDNHRIPQCAAALANLVTSV